MSLRSIYLVLCLFGTFLPLSQIAPWIVENGFDLALFFQELFSTKIGGFFGLDVVVSAGVLFVFIFSEGRRLEVPKLWLPVVATFGVGVSLALPLFLYMRQKKLEEEVGG